MRSASEFEKQRLTDISIKRKELEEERSKINKKNINKLKALD